MSAARQRAALAIDPGEKRTGFAVVDALRLAAHPLDVCAAGLDSEALLAHLDGLLEERDVGTLVVGLPLNMDGTVGARAERVSGFCARLRERYPDLEVALQDERLSTKEAEDRLREAGHHGDERKKRRDSWSALVILEDWMREERMREQRR